MSSDLIFKIASEDWEFKQIHSLNYKTFVEEIPQHHANQEKRLIDKFHGENTYLICIRDKRLIGMLACRDKRPFSLDSKLANLDSYLPPHQALCEIRLLSIEENSRGGRVFPGLMNLLLDYCNQKEYDLALISGTVRQLKLYKHLGFIPFGPLVGEPGAYYQPMYLTRSNFTQKSAEFSGLLKPQPLKKSLKSIDENEVINFLPGPVSLKESVRRAFAGAPISHRSERFLKDFTQTKQHLTRLVHAQNVEILIGTGTLANDAVAAQLASIEGIGLVLSNGEFGERLLDHAQRAKLNFQEYKASWGEPFTYEELERILDLNPSLRWLWAVHLETSTGVLNDLLSLKNLCSKRGILLCLDCVSSIASLPVDLEGVFLASGVSGKALGSYPGLCMIYSNQGMTNQTDISDMTAKALPRYLDLGLYHAAAGVPFTHSSNLIQALQEAVFLTLEKDFSLNAKFAAQLRAQLRELNMTLVAPEHCTAPNVITFALPDSLRSIDVGEKLENEGYLLSYRSAYLLERNWLQICLMGEYDEKDIGRFPLVFASVLSA